MEPLEQRMERLGIREEDLLEKFILGSGSGGQKINKTSSCVYLKHLPTGIEVRCQRERSRTLNRKTARILLCNKIEKQLQKALSEKTALVEKKKRQRRKRTKSGQEKVLQNKKKRSETKALRKKPTES